MKDFFSSFKTLSFWKEILVVIAGTFVAAVAVEYFIIPSKLILGSVAGLSIVLSTILEGMGIAFKASTLILLINAFLIVLAIVFLGKEVGAKTVVASLLIGPFIDLLDRTYPYTRMIQPGFSSVMLGNTF